MANQNSFLIYLSLWFFFRLAKTLYSSPDFEKELKSRNIQDIHQSVCPIETFCIENFDAQINQVNSDFYQIGKGNFGTVYNWRNLDALKVQIVEQTSDLYPYLLKEINMGNLAQATKTNYLSNLKNCCSEIISFNNNFATYRFFLQFDLYRDGNLFDFICESRNSHFVASPQWKWSIAINVIESVKELHELSYVHRDIKTTNIFLKDSYHAVLGDFGLAFHLTQNTYVNEFAGTPGYMPPEAQNNKLITFSFDIYSLGIVLFEIMNGLNFQNRSPNLLEKIENYCKKQNLLDGLLVSDWEIQFYCEHVEDLVLKMLQNDYNSRPTILDVKSKMLNLHEEFLEMHEKIKLLSQQISSMKTELELNDFQVYLQVKHSII